MKKITWNSGPTTTNTKISDLVLKVNEIIDHLNSLYKPPHFVKNDEDKQYKEVECEYCCGKCRHVGENDFEPEQSRGECEGRCKHDRWIKICDKCTSKPLEDTTEEECKYCHRDYCKEGNCVEAFQNAPKPQEVEPTEEWEEVIRAKVDYDEAELGCDWGLDELIYYISSLLERKDREWRERIEKIIDKVEESNPDSTGRYNACNEIREALSDLLEREEL